MIVFTDEGLEVLIRRNLTKGQIIIATDMVNGRHAQEIADKYCVTIGAVKQQMTAIYQKFGNFQKSAKKHAWFIVAMKPFVIFVEDKIPDPVVLKATEAVELIAPEPKKLDVLPIGKMNGLLEQTVEV